jgi:hypothetical protein
MRFLPRAAVLAFPALLSACATSYTITPIPSDGQQVRYLQGTATTFSEKRGSAIQVTPYGVNQEGRLVFAVAAFNKSMSPQNFGVENVHLLGANGEQVKVFTSNELQSEAKNRATWAQVGIVLAGISAAAAANASAYSTTSGSVYSRYGSASFYAQTYDPAVAYAGTAAASANTAYGIAQVQYALDNTLTRLRGEILQTTTIDPGKSFGGTTISESLRGDYPRKFSVSVLWGTDEHAFSFVVTKEGQPIPQIPQSALAAPSTVRQSAPVLKPEGAPPIQNAAFQSETPNQEAKTVLQESDTLRQTSDTLKQPCTRQQQVDARIARMNGYTNGPKCD